MSFNYYGLQRTFIRQAAVIPARVSVVETLAYKLSSLMMGTISNDFFNR
jgi:hypothetical protein